MKTDVKEIMKELETGVKNVFTSEKYKDYLDFMGRFYNYSTNNIILIMLQNPQASLVAGYKTWQTKFNRQVRKGEKGLTIIAPCQHKKKVEHGDEEKEITWLSYRTVKVFDISQTDGDDVPNIVTTLTGDVTNFESLYENLKSLSPVPVSFEEINTGAKGFYSITDKKIVIKKGMSEQQTIKTLVHEISHAMLHSEKTDDTKNEKEVQAESVAYVVCNALGIDTSDYSFGYIATWSKDKEVDELNYSMEIIRKTSNEIIERLKNVA